jgi:D-arabinose 1-dehydrogenase-like Zn-dependent alcohol dehydrogenase
VCEHCRTGWSQLCARQTPKVYGMTANGGHAPYLKVPARTLVSLPEALSFETGAAISCGTGTAYAALRRINLAGNHTIAIFGQGPVGLSATQLAVARVRASLPSTSAPSGWPVPAHLAPRRWSTRARPIPWTLFVN